jgi:hypothetical protein
MSIEFLVIDNKEFNICNEDARHHARFFSTGNFGDGRTTPTPVEVFTFTSGFGIVADNYLDQFPPESAHYKEIQEFKSQTNASKE